MAYYDEISEGYEELHMEEQQKKITLIRSLVDINPSYKLLDVGCGTGFTTEPWSCIRFGIDPSERLLQKARDKENITYKKAAAENIPYPDDFFDVVISITAIQNFDDIEKGLNEIKRVGKDKFVLTFLKKSPKAEIIENLIRKYFDVSKKVEEEKDLIFLVGF